MSKKDDDTQIKKYVVLPEVIDEPFKKTEPQTAIKQLTDFIIQKTLEAKKCVEATSAVSFMANNLQNRQLCTEFSVKMAKFFNDIEVSCEAECNKKLDQLSKSNEKIAVLWSELKNAWKQWETFLESVDKSLEELAGPCNPKSIASADNIKLANTKGKAQTDQGTLLSYVQNSPFQMMFIEVVFSINDCAHHMLQIYEKHNEFQALNCDILLLTKSGDGSGFLKLVGVPFKLLLDEEQSLAKILQHRQSAVSISGQRAIAMLAEISKGVEPQFVKSGFDKNGGALLMNHDGTILYNHSCKEHSDWPDVESILVEVKKNKKDNPESEKLVNGISKGTKSANVEVSKKKCCIIM